MRVLRVYHGGRDAAHRARDRALQAGGVDLELVVPADWPGGTGQETIAESFPVHELEVARAGDVNRHLYRSSAAVDRILRDVRPDVLDLHEEPFSAAARQWLRASSAAVPVVMYTAQNVDKRYPPPFAQYERAAHRRVSALHPCTAQAASVARGKGFNGLIEILPLGYDETIFAPGEQSANDEELVLGLFGRLVPEKGAIDAVHILAALHAIRPTRLVLAGAGPEAAAARELAGALGVADRLELEPWRSTEDLAATYRSTHVVLVPSRPTQTWVEQFGRVIVEGQASGALVAGYASGSIPEVAGDAAVLSSVGDRAGLAKGIIEVLADPSEFARRRRRGLELSVPQTWTHVAEQQADLYRRVLAGDVDRIDLPRSPRGRRAAARSEFGPTASTTAGVRPFALPLLRRGGLGPDLLARSLDGIGEGVARLR